MASLAGAAMSLITDPGWVDLKTSGLGWIAVALVTFATWEPLEGFVGFLFVWTSPPSAPRFAKLCAAVDFPCK